jgi:hypothetical protein
MISHQQQEPNPPTDKNTSIEEIIAGAASATNEKVETWNHALEEEANHSSLTLESLTEDGKNSSGIPAIKFIEDIDSFSNSFTPPASAELLIGAYSDLFAQYKRMEENLIQKSE